MYANQLGNKYNPAQEAVDIHDKRITDLTNSDIGKTLVVNDELNVVPQQLDLSNYMVKGVDYVTAGRKSGSPLPSYATIEGYNNISKGLYSHVEGTENIAVSSYSHAEGVATVAVQGHSEGTWTISYGDSSHSEGNGDVLGVFYLTSEDDKYLVEGLTDELSVGSIIRLENNRSKVDIVTSIDGDYITVQNPYDFGTELDYEPAVSVNGVAFGDYSHSEGEDTISKGMASHAEGSFTLASGDSSHAEGSDSKSIGIYSHAEGMGTQAQGDNSHSEGSGTVAQGSTSHAEGQSTTASGRASHAEGSLTRSGGNSSHSEGYSTNAYGNYSHAEGRGTIADRQSQHVFGEYNVRDSGTGTTKGTYVEIVGNGTLDNNRSNARTLDWNGNETLAGKLTVGTAPSSDMDVATKQYVDTAIQTALQAIPDVSVEGM